MASCDPLSSLTPEQLAALHAQTSFLLIADLPHGSVLGLDGTFNKVKQCSGFKLLPPGIHILTVEAPSTASGSSGIPIPRRGTVFYVPPPPAEPRVLNRTFDTHAESLVPSPRVSEIISPDVLKTLDPTLAPYPYAGFQAWQSLFPPTLKITDATLERVLGPASVEEGAADASGRFWDLDGLTLSQGEDLDGAVGDTLAAERVLRHRRERDGHVDTGDVERAMKGTSLGGERVQGEGEAKREGEGAAVGWARFDLRKSWREGAIGQERSEWARNKSWLFWDIVERQCGGDPEHLLVQLALLLPLAILFQAPSLLLQTYRRIIEIFARAHLSPAILPLPSIATTLSDSLPSLYGQLLALVHAQLAWLPEDFFSAHFPESENWWRDAVEELGTSAWRGAEAAERYDQVHELVQRRFGWDLEASAVEGVSGLEDTGDAAVSGMNTADNDDEEDEDEEDRPVVVETTLLRYNWD